MHMQNGAALFGGRRRLHAQGKSEKRRVKSEVEREILIQLPSSHEAADGGVGPGCLPARCLGCKTRGKYRKNPVDLLPQAW